MRTAWWALLVVLLLASASCVYEATEVLVVVDTDLRPDPRVDLRATVRRGTTDIAVGAMPDRATDGGVHLPASFAIVPGAGDAPDQPVTLSLEATSGAVTLRRLVRFQFVPRTSLLVRVFLPASCNATEPLCPPPGCSRREFCERQGETCGDEGMCVGIAVTPDRLDDAGVRADAGRIDVPAAMDVPRDVPVSMDVPRDVPVPTDVPRDAPVSMDVPRDVPRDAPVSMDVHTARCGDMTCDPGENASNCNSDCPSRCGDAMCTAGESTCSCPQDCGSACGDGCCNGGENICNCGDCGNHLADGACDCGESTCSDPGECGSACGDGCCNGGENICNCGDCGNHCGNGVCDCGENCGNCPGDCTAALNCGDCYARCCDNTLVHMGVIPYSDCNGPTTIYNACSPSGPTGACHNGVLRVQFNGTQVFSRSTTCPTHC